LAPRSFRIAMGYRRRGEARILGRWQIPYDSRDPPGLPPDAIAAIVRRDG